MITNPRNPSYKNKKPKINRINFENCDNVLKCLFFNIPYYLIIFYFR